MSPISPQDDQAEILQAVLRLYRQFGPDKVSMDDIAKATGRSRTSLYYYYKTRDEVFHAAIDAIIQDIAKEIRKAVAGIHPLEEQVYTFCIAKLRISREWKLTLDTMWSSMAPTKNTKAFEGIHHKLVHEEGLILKEILSAATAGKKIRDLSAEEINHWVFIITSGIRGIRNEIPDQNLTPSYKAPIRVLSEMATKWLKS